MSSSAIDLKILPGDKILGDYSNVFDQLPKAELHIHLEGTISPAVIWQLANHHQIATPVTSYREFKRLFGNYRNFNDFRDLWLLMVSCLRTKDDYKQIARAFLERCQKEHIIYTEVHFTPYTHYCSGVDAPQALQAILDVFDTLSNQFSTDARLIVDIPRSRQGNDASAYTLEILEKFNHKRLIGLGLSGFEPGNPARRFETYFDRAARLGYRRVTHAGESAGAESVCDAIEILGAERIGHGVRVVEEQETLERVARDQIPLEICITSNIMTRVFSHEDHPVKSLFDQECSFSLNSDDPSFFNTTLSQEYRIAVEKYKFSMSDVYEIAKNGIHHSFLDGDEKAKFLKILNDSWHIVL
jgi:adenosine deaminase